MFSSKVVAPASLGENGFTSDNNLPVSFLAFSTICVIHTVSCV
jgi:hypothetical protein